MKTSPRVFSLDEANALLPQLEALLARLEERHGRTARLHDELLMHELLHQAELPPGAAAKETDLDLHAQTLEASFADLEKEVEEIRAMGCVIRNLERGWMDFLGRRGDEPVYFCRRRGEKQIRFYHSVQAPAVERFPI